MDTDRLRGILDLVEESLGEPEMSGEDLAARAYLSRFHFDRLVRAALGEPPGAFRRRLLMERAAHALTGSSAPVIEVAFDAGYGSPEAFTRAFVRAYGSPPSEYRLAHRMATAGAHQLPAGNGIHFHPPGALRLPAVTRSSGMDVLTRMLDHHLWLSQQIIARAAQLDDTVLDRPIELSVEGIDDSPTLRSLCDRLVGQLEMWVRAFEGKSGMPPVGATDAAGLASRLAAVAPRYRELVIGPIDAGHGDDTFVDATCDPPETFSYGGALAHVLTFAAVRRTMAIGALDSAGVSDLGAGDPMHFVGGTGHDASEISRQPPTDG